MIHYGTAIRVRNVSGPVLIANNAAYSRWGRAINLISGKLSLVTLSGNVGSGGLSGGSAGYVNGYGIMNDFVKGRFDLRPPFDLFPSPGSALLGAGDPAHATSVDFNESPRRLPPDAGAYSSQGGGNPGWAVTTGFKRVAVGDG